MFNRVEYPQLSIDGFDFGPALAYVMVFQAIEAMRMRIINSGNYEELKLFDSNVSNTILWSKLLASRYTPPKNKKELIRELLENRWKTS